ncbi:hypothetical protein NESM_000038800 [Novymonas esmeraldas]|uniref:Uncharacterized protein n=1 Tax=Novymonas esmeraldas TaxID=1808958 RepID=A0AAW0F2S9_9TRYP
MGLALCHSVPRDVVVQLALLLLFVTLVLQAASIGLHGSNDAAGYFTLRGTASSRAQAVVLVAAHPATYLPPGSAVAGGSATASVHLCNPSAETLSYSCARFAEAFHAVNGLTVSSFVACVTTVVVGVFVVARMSHTTLSLLYRLLFAACVPAALQCAAVGVFFARVVPHGRQDAARLGGWPAGELRFHRRAAANLMVSATALVCAAAVMLFARWLSVLCMRRQFESEREHTEGDVQKLTAAHMVNDDWLRQRQILLSHARSVKVEMAVKGSHGGAEALSASTGGQREPYNPRQTDSTQDPRRNSSSAGGDSDEDTLHFHMSIDPASRARSAVVAERASAAEQTGPTTPPPPPPPQVLKRDSPKASGDARAESKHFSDADPSEIRQAGG